MHVYGSPFTIQEESESLKIEQIQDSSLYTQIIFLIIFVINTSKKKDGILGYHIIVVLA